jgi:hypothetical protein
MKEGDELYCKKSIYRWITSGKTYKIIHIYSESPIIIDDEGDENDFSLVKEYKMEDYFYTLKDFRKQKLMKINESK